MYLLILDTAFSFGRLIDFGNLVQFPSSLSPRAKVQLCKGIHFISLSSCQHSVSSSHDDAVLQHHVQVHLGGANQGIEL